MNKNIGRVAFMSVFFAIAITAWLVCDSKEGFIIALFAAAYFCDKLVADNEVN